MNDSDRERPASNTIRSKSEPRRAATANDSCYPRKRRHFAILMVLMALAAIAFIVYLLRPMFC